MYVICEFNFTYYRHIYLTSINMALPKEFINFVYNRQVFFYFSAQARRKELRVGDPFNCGSDFPLLHNTIYIWDMQGHRSIRYSTVSQREKISYMFWEFNIYFCQPKVIQVSECTLEIDYCYLSYSATWFTGIYFLCVEPYSLIVLFIEDYLAHFVANPD